MGTPISSATNVGIPSKTDRIPIYRPGQTSASKYYIESGSSFKEWVEYYGAVGDGTTDDTAAINAAIAAIGEGIMRFTPTKTYLIKNKLDASGSNKTWIGYGATLKRANELQSLTTVTVASGATSVTVASSTGFVIGDTCLLLQVTAPYAGTANGEHSNLLTISNIAGNVITVNAVTSLPYGTFSIGAKFVKVFDMISSSGGVSNCRILGLKFDGNRTNNTSYLGWIYSATMRSLAIGSVVRDCLFSEIPNENMFVQGPSVIDSNYAEGLNGSFCHLSNGALGVEIGQTRIVNNWVYNACQTAQAINGHSEGYVTISAQPLKSIINGNNFYADSTTGAGMGNLSVASLNTTLTNNIFFGLKGVLKAISNPVGADPATICVGVVLSGNEFINCDFLYFSADSFDGRITVGGGCDQINVSDNLFINTRLAFESVSNLVVANNSIYFENGFTAIATAIPVDTSYANAITFSECIHVSVIGNVLKNLAATQSSTLTNGIMLNTTSLVIKSDASTSTNYLYGGRNFLVSGNVISGFGTGIIDISPAVTQATRAALSYQNMRIANNNIFVRADSSGLRAAYIGPGVFFEGNNCYGGANATNGVLCFGTTSAKSALLNGPIVRNNNFVGFDNSVTVGNATALYNCLVSYNTYDGTITDSSGGFSTIANNTALINESVVIYNERENIAYY